MDAKDLKIIEELLRDSSQSTRQISKKALIPITTVHKRINKLRQSGIIKKYTVELDNSKTGRSFFVIILVSVDYKSLRDSKKDQHQLAKELKALPEVENVYVVTGGMDIVVTARVKDVEEYDNFLLKKFQRIPGIDKTQSLVVIHQK